MRKHLPLTAVLCVAAIVRLWAIDFCLPTLTCRPDEEAVASIATGFFARDLNPHFFDWPPLFIYAVALSMVPYFKYAKFAGWIRSEYRFLQSISADPTPLFLAARIISAAAGTASVWVVYQIGLRLFDRTTALLSAAFLALAYLHVRDSHFGVTDVSATFLVLLSLLACARFSATSENRDLIRAGALAGMATATKYNAALIALPILWAIVTDPSRRSPRAMAGRAALLGSTAAIVFLVLAPFTVIEFTAFLRSLNSISSHLAGGHGVNVGRGWWVHLTSSLRHGVGTPQLVAGFAGLAWAIWKSPRTGIMLALFPLATLVAIGGGLTVFARYALPVVPFLSIGAAYATTEIVRGLVAWRLRPRWQPALVCALALLVMTPSAMSVWKFDRLIAVEDSRVLAARWIERRFPNGATIGETERRWNRLSYLSNASTSLKYTSVVLTREMTNPDVIVVTESPLHPSGMPLSLDPERAPHYVRAMETSRPERPGATYDWQDEFYVPLAGIDHLERPGPRIELYVRSDGRSDERSGNRSDGRSGNRSDGRSGNRSDGRSDERSGNRSDERSGNRSDGRSGERSGDRSGDRSDSRQSRRPIHR